MVERILYKGHHTYIKRERGARFHDKEVVRTSWARFCCKTTSSRSVISAPQNISTVIEPRATTITIIVTNALILL